MKTRVLTEASPSAPNTVGAWLALPRGGYYVRTSQGPIQIGIPPETIKDVMELKLDVPIAYVLPRDLFDRRRGLSVAEFEFPAYYSFFLLKRRCRLVVLSEDVERRVRSIFQESLFGPTGEPLASEFADGYAEARRPHFQRESEYFRTLPGRGRIEADDLVEFVRIQNGQAEIAPGVVLVDQGDALLVQDHGRNVAVVGATINLPGRMQTDPDIVIDPTQPTPSDGPPM